MEKKKKVKKKKKNKTTVSTEKGVEALPCINSILKPRKNYKKEN